MIKCFCDKCGEESTRLNQFEYLVHLDDLDLRAGYVDNYNNRISGRTVEVGLCNRCYNIVVGAAVKLLK